MKLSILQLNINSDNYWDQLIPYITSHDFDVMQFQEVTGPHSVSGNINSKLDGFKELQKTLDALYIGELIIPTTFTSHPSSYMGNATFYKKDFSFVHKHIITMHDRKEPFPSDANNFEDEARLLLHLQLSIQGKTISFLNTHFAWAQSPKEESHQTKQGEIMLEYLKQIKKPFVFTGDFNLDPDQPTIQKVNKLARNLTTENKVSNTLNPRTHRAKHLFPKGAAVDYIFVSPDIKINNFSVVEEDLSDHFGLIVEIEI